MGTGASSESLMLGPLAVAAVAEITRCTWLIMSLL